MIYNDLVLKKFYEIIPNCKIYEMNDFINRYIIQDKKPSILNTKFGCR